MKPEKQMWRQSTTAGRPTWVAIATLGLALLPDAAYGQTTNYRGLWVGQVTLKYANQVTVPLDEDNVARPLDPEVTSPTFDEAHLRLILHVDSAGKVSLLKDVAILDRTDGFLGSESDFALVTDERLYPELPPQPAVRIASAVFDFGDGRATDAVTAVVEAAAVAARGSVNTAIAGLDAAAIKAKLDDVAMRLTIEANAEAAALGAATLLLDAADVAARFESFLSQHLNSSKVNEIADAADPATAAAGALAEAQMLEDDSDPPVFYSDSRGVLMVNAIVSAVNAAQARLDTMDPPVGDTEAQAVLRRAAHNTASAYADPEAKVLRFLAGKTIGDMIVRIAEAAAENAAGPGSTEETIRAAIDAATVSEDDTRKIISDVAEVEALQLQVARYDDSRATDAIAVIVEAVVASAAGSAGGSVPEDEIREAATDAGRDALVSDAELYAVDPRVALQAPTLDYTEFVRADDPVKTNEFMDSIAIAAEAAAEGAVAEVATNPLFTDVSIEGAAKAQAANRLRATFSEAALARRTALPMVGDFGPGDGDTKLTWDKYQDGDDDLEPVGDALRGTIHLAASHPTNPFRHRRHPDHVIGFDVVRKIRLDFHGEPGDALDRVGFGVDRVTGVYRETIEGLHKPLGRNKNIGLKVEGTFELSRISLIDTLTAL